MKYRNPANKKLKQQVIHQIELLHLTSTIAKKLLLRNKRRFIRTIVATYRKFPYFTRFKICMFTMTYTLY